MPEQETTITRCVRDALENLNSAQLYVERARHAALIGNEPIAELCGGTLIDLRLTSGRLALGLGAYEQRRRQQAARSNSAISAGGAVASEPIDPTQGGD